MKLHFALLLGFIANFAQAESYQFVSIEHLIEQKVGQAVLPQIYQRLNIDITISPLPGKHAQHHATSGKSDGEIMRIFSYGVENPTVLRVPTPYYFLETMAFIRKGANVKIRSPRDLKNYSIAKVRGVKHTNNITQGLSKIHDMSSTEKCMNLLENGLVDVVLTNTTDGLMALRNLNIKNIIPIDKPLARLDLYHYIHEDHQNLIPIVDKAIQEMKSNGSLALAIKQAENSIIDKSIIASSKLK